MTPKRATKIRQKRDSDRTKKEQTIMENPNSQYFVSSR